MTPKRVKSRVSMGTWVDLSKELPGGSSSPARTTPVPFGGESDYMRMLREAQVLDHHIRHNNLCLPFITSSPLKTAWFCISMTAAAVLHPFLNTQIKKLRYFTKNFGTLSKI